MSKGRGGYFASLVSPKIAQMLKVPTGPLVRVAPDMYKREIFWHTARA